MKNESDSIGRNDPCPCGSGRKFKKCCLDKQRGAAPGFRPLSEKPAHSVLPRVPDSHDLDTLSKAGTGLQRRGPQSVQRSIPVSGSDLASSLPSTSSNSSSTTLASNIAGDAASNPAAALKQAMAGLEFHTLEQAQAFADKFMHTQNQAPRDEFLGLSSEHMRDVLYKPFDSPSTVSFNRDIQIPEDVPFLQFFDKIANATDSKSFKPTAKGNLPRQFTRDVAMQYWGRKNMPSKPATAISIPKQTSSHCILCDWLVN